jgi:hypothetical protein
MAEQVRNQISGGIFLSAIVQGQDLSLSLPPEVIPALSGLPAPTPAFCGRAEELRTLVTALSPPVAGERREELVSVTGTAGVGKTELALQAVHAALANGWFPGGALFASAGGRDGPGTSQILDGFLRALGVPAAQVPAGLDGKARLYALILAAFARQRRRILILIDDGAPGREAAALLPPETASQAIVTSREPAEMPVGLEVKARALDTADGTELLRRVLTIAHADDSRVDADHAAAARVSDLCGGLPVALRIVGALLTEDPALPLARVAENLEDESSRLDELQYMGSGVRACFDRSYRYLDRESARLFRLLPVLPAPVFTAREAATLTGLDLAAAGRSLSALAPLLERTTSSDQWRMPILARLYANEHGLRHAAEDGRTAALRRLMDARHTQRSTHPSP